ncbi:TadE/TadG family type IV pilus assembly protein [uncultured Thiodictyon sp.]|uniref:TadE/TadG family type IV pilus assembly protein n=1 Tax=uncultured Thiodictyon sp. TaxID=1846217 RepID=UPI0025F1F905|nr:TadE/TadG family type IV pilus assembly protein [uncultured Thiodictyon sp.]
MTMTINRTRCKGASMVEFALVSSIMFLVLFAIIEFGRYLFVEHTILYATQEGARVAQVGGTTNAIWAKINDTAGLANATGLSVYSYSANGTTYADLYPGKTSSPPALAKDTNPAGVGGSYLKLRVRYTFKFVLPWIKRLFPSDQIVIDTSVLYRVEKF